MDDFNNKIKNELGWKILATIMAFIWLLNIIIIWFASDLLPGTSGNNKTLIKILWSVGLAIFWIPGIIVSLFYIWS